ncbi:hypothetical protein V5799_017894 [Amblyomma americanum]|uniref:Ferritin n=1 Tax=Amblyomma americanum TaxID=6943 RepID=A0AAQ4F1V7_AMBAM
MLRLLVVASALAAAGSNNLDEQASQNKYFLHDRCRLGLQEQINLELHASLVYTQMAAYLANNNVARAGFAHFFRHQSDEEREHAHKLIDYVNLRGGTVSTVNLQMPTTATWMSVLDVLQRALALEHDVTNRLYELHRLADDHCRDPQWQRLINIPPEVSRILRYNGKTSKPHMVVCPPFLF